MNNLALLAIVALGLSVKVAAQSWNQPIPEPATESTPQTIKLANQLNKVGAKFFGAYWCPACKEQMKLFGKQAGRKLNYVECGRPDIYPDQVSQCRDAKIESIPTWTRPGKNRLEGVQSINALEQWSDNKAKQERRAMHQHNSTDHFLQEYRFKNKASNSTDPKNQAQAVTQR